MKFKRNHDLVEMLYRNGFTICFLNSFKVRNKIEAFLSKEYTMEQL